MRGIKAPSNLSQKIASGVEQYHSNKPASAALDGSPVHGDSIAVELRCSDQTEHYTHTHSHRTARLSARDHDDANHEPPTPHTLAPNTWARVTHPRGLESPGSPP